MTCIWYLLSVIWYLISDIWYLIYFIYYYYYYFAHSNIVRRRGSGNTSVPGFYLFLYNIPSSAVVADGHPTLAFSLGIAVQALAAGVKPRARSGFWPQRERGCGGHFFWQVRYLLFCCLLFVVCCLLLVVVVTNPVLPAPPQGLRLGAFGRTAGRVFLLL